MTKTLLLLTQLWVTGLALASCSLSPPAKPPLPSASLSPIAAPAVSTESLLQESWQAYKQRFIQSDGRVIDREAKDRTVSEGQAYAMLRSVLMDDRDTFDRTLSWAETNLQRRNTGQTNSPTSSPTNSPTSSPTNKQTNNQPDNPIKSQTDSLWAWKWGQDDQNNWRTLDGNFASDGDLDAITALILASRRWNQPDYLRLARTKLKDLWEQSTLELPTARSNSTGPSPSGNSRPVRYFLPGPAAAFVQSDRVYLNPSYLAPYAFRLFAQVDPDHNWLSLVDSSYAVLNDSANLSAVGLPSDWVQLNRTTGQFEPVAAPRSLQTLYAFDAYRVWWRVALDAAWFNAPQAKDYLQRHLPHLRDTWQAKQAIPAQIDLQGKAIVPYESTAQYAMLQAAFSITDPDIAAQIRQQKLLPPYHDGFWDSDSAYYTQNLGWFGLSFPNPIALSWLRP